VPSGVVARAAVAEQSTARPLGPRRHIGSRAASQVALLPAMLIALVVYCGATCWTMWISLTSSRMLPNSVFVGLRQYQSLMANERWQVSVTNLATIAVLFISAALVVGFVLAVLIDQRVRAEGVLRSMFLYPFSMSFIVTGLAWRWLLDPTLGIEKLLHDWGFEAAKFDWMVRQDRVVYCLVIAAIWHASGLVMAIMLAGLRGVDPEIWKAARVDGLPPWRVYLQVIVPMMGGSFATATILLATSVVRLYDLTVAMTNGGPGVASEVPAKFVMDNLFERQNIGLATAAATSMLITIAAVLGPWLYWQSRRASSGRHA
jgi:glucose/mannose transport system permease protein